MNATRTGYSIRATILAERRAARIAEVARLALAILDGRRAA
jgi:hypothetical protein